MKLAARYPIKNCPELTVLLSLTHLIVFVFAVQIYAFGWPQLVISAALMGSFLIAYKQLSKLTTANGDLCWTGDNWTMVELAESNKLHYLTLKPTSWLTSQFCLLKFDLAEQQVVWLFTKKHLGERSYRELCYLAKQDLRLSLKNNV